MTDDTDKTCSACGEGKLLLQVARDIVEYKGQTTEMDRYYYLCNTCGSELANGKQIDLNAKLMTIFCKKVDGLLSGVEVRAIRERLGLSEEEASRAYSRAGQHHFPNSRMTTRSKVRKRTGSCARRLKTRMLSCKPATR